VPAAQASDRMLGQAATPLDVSDPGSRLNVLHVARALALVEVAPKSEFHLLDALRVRGGVPELPGRALVDGEVVVEQGGGICQVAGTIYAASLNAGLGVVERNTHSAAVRTLPPGLDAAVSFDGGSDLVLWNGYDFPVRLNVRVEQATLVATWSARSPARDVQLVRDADGAVVRYVSDGREEMLLPAPPSVSHAMTRRIISTGGRRSADTSPTQPNETR
jgi:vancomycin resistance protein YoaR